MSTNFVYLCSTQPQNQHCCQICNCSLMYKTSYTTHVFYLQTKFHMSNSNGFAVIVINHLVLNSI
jgi:hypothetical protein